MSDATPTVPGKAPKRWLAVLLSIPWPGLGFAYLGRGWISLLVFVTMIGCWVIVFAAVLAGRFTFTIFVATLAACIVTWLSGIVATFFVARRPHWSPRPIYSRWYGLLAIVVAWAIFGFAMPLPIEAFSIPARSMMPALVPGDRFMSMHWDQLNRVPRRGEMVVIRLRELKADFVKRVIGLPGDTVQLKDNVVFVNGQPWPQKPMGDYVYQTADSRSIRIQSFEENSPDVLTYRILYNSSSSPGANTPAFIVPPGKVFVLGDNRDNSLDSRFPQIGLLPLEDLRALPLFLYYSQITSRIGSEVK